MKNIERREIGVQTYWRRPVHMVEQAQVRTHTHTNEIYRLLVCFLYAELNRDKLFTAIAKCNICHISDFLFIDLGWFWWCICSGGILPRVWNIWEKKNTSKWLLLITMDYSHDISTGFHFYVFRCWISAVGKSARRICLCTYQMKYDNPNDCPLIK